MDLYHCILQDQRPRLESPAKVFAKLKAKLQKESATKEDGADFNSPRKRAAGIWTTGEHKEKQRFGSYPHEMQPLTLSPIASPPKASGYNVYVGADTVCGNKRSGRSFLESTAVSRSLFLSDKGQIQVESPQLRSCLPSRTLVKAVEVENERGRSVSDDNHALFNLPMSQTSVLSPMRKRLRKRTWEQHEINKISNNVTNGGMDEPHRRKTSTSTGNQGMYNGTGTEELCSRRGISGDHGHLGPILRSTAEKRCREGFPMSPAKIFASMKERESKRKKEQPHEVICSRKNLFSEGNIRDTPLSTAQILSETQDAGITHFPQNVVPLTPNRTDSADSQSEGNCSEDAPTSAVPLVWQGDPLITKTPQVSIPQKHDKAVFKRNKGPKQIQFPSESVIHLKKWFLRKNHKGLFVDGIHREDNIQWNSNIVVDRVSNSVLKTVSGRVYILVGNMKMDYASGFPRWLLKKFAKGFPRNWKELYEKFLIEAGSNQSSTVTKRNSARSSNTNTSTLKRCKQTPASMSESCLPNSSFCSRVSRSGRAIKPPLEYWKGGRVVLDADMNVQVFECYETTICEVNTTMSARPSQKPVHVVPQCSEGSKQNESPCDKEASVPLRKVKYNRRSVTSDRKSFKTLEPLVEKLSNPEELSGRKTKSTQRCPATVEAVPQKQSKHVKSKKTSDSANRCSVREKRGNVKESAAAHDKTLQDESSSEELSLERQQRGKQASRKKDRKVQNKSKPDESLTHSSEDSGKRQNKRTSKTNKNEGQTKKKPTKCTKISPPTKSLPVSTQSSRKCTTRKGNTQDDNEDEWTEAELMKLQEAVIYYPKHMEGYWAEVARAVGTRSAEECHNKHTSQGTSKTPIKAAKKGKKQKEAAPVTDNPVISAKVGTFKRKQQVRQFLENMPREDVDDVFSSAYMQSKRFEIPSLCPSDDQDLTVSDLEPLTPRSSCFPEVKTPQCLDITPGMMGSPDRDCDDKYIYQLQKRMKKNQFNICKVPPTAKSFTPTPLTKQPMKRCSNAGNNSFVVWEMFSGNNAAPADSGEEEDFYFSDND